MRISDRIIHGFLCDKDVQINFDLFCNNCFLMHNAKCEMVQDPIFNKWMLN
jgi:hypothetical protein